MMRKNLPPAALCFGAVMASILALGCNELLGLDGPAPVGAGAGGSNADGSVQGMVTPPGPTGLEGGGGSAPVDEPGEAGAPKSDICAPASHLEEFIPDPSAYDKINLTYCDCTPEAPSCHAIYQLRVDAVAADRWHANLTFQKLDQAPIVEGMTYWIARVPMMPRCSELDTYEVVLGPLVVRAPAKQITVRDVPLWPDQAAFDAAPVGDTRRLFVISDGRNGPESYGKKIWFQGEPMEFRKYCK